MNILEARGIYRSFKVGSEKIQVLKDINLSIKKGTFNVFMGPSGSGKTTLLNILGSLDLPDSGEILLDGENIATASERYRDRIRRKKIGFVFQSVALVSNMSAYENVDFALRINGYARKHRKKRTEECLNSVDLKKRMRHKPFELSGGEQQRVAIARAIAHKPSLLLADEPTAELDTNTGLHIVKLFKELVLMEDITIIMCTHDTSMIDVADNVFMLEDGVMASAG